MSIVKALTTFKKKNGLLQLVQDSIQWTPSTAGSAPDVTIPVSSIQNLQATPPTSAKVMLKIIVPKENESSPDSYVFNFNSDAARVEADAMKDALTVAISAFKTASSGANTPQPGAVSSVAMASAVNSKPTMADLMSASKLENDLELQQSLLRSDKELKSTFTEAVMSGAVTPAQFWSTRLHLLRAHAVERNQTKGPYNVLASIKPTTIDGVAKMSLTREQIQAIFELHPLVKIVYDENVPKISEDQFWSRFFLSRLFKMLKGERIDEKVDPTDTIFDRYMKRDDEDNIAKRRKIEHVPLTIDLTGNEVNISKKGGNQPDLTMRPDKNVPIMKALNSLSQKLVGFVAPADPDRSENSDERYIAEQRLRDLGGDPEEERIILNIQDQRAFFSADASKAHNQFAGLDPTTVLGDMRKALGEEDIDLSVELPAEIDYNKPGAPQPKLYKATKQITAAIRERSAQLTPFPASGNGSANGGLPSKIFGQVQMVHATSNEFLHHFWIAFLSGDEKRARDINNMVNSLRNSKDRIAAIVKAADEEKVIEQAARKKQLHEQYQRTGIRPKKSDMEVGGGGKVVEEMLGPTLEAIEKALAQYQAALDEAEKGSGTPMPT